MLHILNVADYLKILTYVEEKKFVLGMFGEYFKTT